jgi:hypothetical protein
MVKINEFGCLAEEISKKSVEGMSWFLLVLWSKNMKEK